MYDKNKNYYHYHHVKYWFDNEYCTSFLQPYNSQENKGVASQLIHFLGDLIFPTYVWFSIRFSEKVDIRRHDKIGLGSWIIIFEIRKLS